MAYMYTCIVSAFIIQFTIFVKALSIPEESPIEKIIKERKLREAGFTDFELTTIEHITDENTQRLDAASIHRRRRSVEVDDSYNVRIPAFGETYEMKLSHYKSVLHPSAIIVTFNGETESKFEGEHPDCYLTGEVHTHDGIVSASFCYELVGMIGTPTHELHFEVLPHELRQKRSTQDHTTIISRKKREMSLEALNLKDDYMFVNETTKTKTRKKRAVPSTDFEIETAVYCDADFLTYDLTATDTAKRVDNMLIKYNAVQFEWGRVDQLNYNITITIVYMAFLETNPLWYNTSSNLMVPLTTVCSGTTGTSFDHIHMHTGVPSPALGGLAWQNKVCHSTYRCGVSADGVTTYVTTAHEIGHNMGMYHDADKGCTAPNVGVMGGASVGWSTCSRDDMDTMLQSGSAGCLWNDDVADNAITPVQLQGVVLQPAIPGQLMTADEVCESKYESGWRYREYPQVVPTSCNAHSCVDTNLGPQYGRMIKQSNSIDGVYCADNQICFQGSCQGFSAAQITNPVYRQGNWSEWSSWSGCSRTCGRGINFRRRKCNNPSPINYAGCDGNEYDALACNTEPCAGDSAIKSTLIEQRASETCQRLIDNNVINGTIYSAVGSIYSGFNWGICEVDCAPNTGYTTPFLTRFGLIENGTPCTNSLLSTADANLYPRRPGYYYACLEGYCEKFDCMDTTGTSEYDSCGVCNGDDSTCLVVQDTFTENLDQYTRREWTELPVGAYDIQISYTWSDMKQYYIEIHTKDNQPIIASNIVGPSRIFDTGDNPISYGGTLWHFKYLTQIMYADGPLTEPVVVKIYNLRTNANVGINLIYSTPLGNTTLAYSNDTTTEATNNSDETTTSMTDTTQGQNISDSSATESLDSIWPTWFVIILSVAAVCVIALIVTGIVYVVRRTFEKGKEKRRNSTDSHTAETLKTMPFIVSASAPMSTAPMFKPKKKPKLHTSHGFDEGYNSNHVINVNSRENLLNTSQNRRRNSAVPRVD